jgi:hypothetical protein
METKINLNRPKVDDAEIESRKNFQDLVDKFKKESLQKAKKDLRLRRLKKLVYSTVIAGATVFCTVTYINYNSDKKQDNKLATNADPERNKPKEITETKPSKYIQPLTEKANVPYNKYKVNATNGGTITHNKSKIKVPAGSFVKKSGEAVQGDVEIKYREMHDQAEILASGIPMTYDSAGTTYHFESSGMIDIRGSQNGEEVFIKPGKNITVEMASENQESKFNLYALDTVGQKWIYKGKDKITVEKDPHAGQNNLLVDEKKILENPVIVKIDEKIKVIEVRKDSVKVVTEKKIVSLPKVTDKPITPRESKGGRPKFELDVDPVEHPELAAYKDVAFEVGEENKTYDKSWNAITWADVQLADGPKKGENYQLNLVLGQRREKLIVYPALTGKSYEKAMKDYQKKFEQYEIAVKKKADEEARLKKELEDKIKAYNEAQAKLASDREKEVIRIRKKQEQELESQFKNLDSDAKITRTFLCSNFGVWNMDCPGSGPAGDKVSATFKSGADILHPRKMFMVDHNANRLITFTEEKFALFTLPSNGNYSLCCSVNGIVYVCSKEEFAKCANENGKATIDLSPVNPEVASVFDLRKGLGLIN